MDRPHVSSITSLRKIQQEQALPSPSCTGMLPERVTCLPALSIAFPGCHPSKANCGFGQDYQNNSRGGSSARGSRVSRGPEWAPSKPPHPTRPSCSSAVTCAPLPWLGPPLTITHSEHPHPSSCQRVGRRAGIFFFNFWSEAAAVGGAGTRSSGQQASHPLPPSQTLA